MAGGGDPPMATTPRDSVTSPRGVLARGNGLGAPGAVTARDSGSAVIIKGIVTPVTAVTAKAPAKVNLQLAVGPARAHGYHDVVSVYHAVSLFDEVTVSPAERDSVVGDRRGGRQRPRRRHQPRHAGRRRPAPRGGPGGQGLPGLAIRIFMSSL